MPSFKYEELYSRLPGWDTRLDQATSHEFKICCPFHAEKTPSFHVNVETGRWHCFGACDRGGGAAEIEAKLGISQETVKPGPKTPANRPSIPETEVDKLHRALVDNPSRLALLESTCGITLATVQKFKLGWSGSRYAWPVYDSEGLVRNIRLYEYGCADSQKVISYTWRDYKYGEKNIRLFPLQVLAEDQPYVLLCEGEKDALNALQAGVPAVTATGGAGKWQSEYCTQPLLGKHVVIVYDIDEAGRQGARKIRQTLRKAGIQVSVLALPPEGLPSNGDLTDYIKIRGVSALLDLIQAELKFDIDAYTQLRSLFSINSTDNSNQLVEVDAHVLGKDTIPYTSYRGYELACARSRGNVCNSCGLGNGNTPGYLEHIIPKDDRRILHTVEQRDDQIKRFIAEDCGIVKCALWTAEPMEAERSSVEKLMLSTTVDQKSADDDGPASYVQLDAYSVDTHITPNSVYTFKGRITTHPVNQSNIFIITHADTAQLSVEKFEMTPEIHERLCFFRPRDPSDHMSIIERMNERWYDLQENVSHIYGREKMHAVVDFTVHSLIRFGCFGGEPERCWLEGYIGGDTRQGKSVLAKALHSHYSVGELAGGENTTQAGILGGADKAANGGWMIKWGKAPKNDRGWVTFDECQNISADVMGTLSGMRSSGIAEVNKIRAEKVFARTRILWLSNPRSSVLTGQLAQGIMLLKDVFERQEDIARLDLVTIVRGDDVPEGTLREAMERKERAPVPHIHLGELCHLLIMYAWSRHSMDVNFTREAENEALDASERMAAKYACDIKMVEPMEQRFKLARLAAAVACMMFSVDLDGTLHVHRAHVQAAEAFLYWLYDDTAVGYDKYSVNHRRYDTLLEPAYVESLCRKETEEFFYSIRRLNVVTAEAISNLRDCDMIDARRLFNSFIEQRCLLVDKDGDWHISKAWQVMIEQGLSEKWFLAHRPRMNGKAHGYAYTPDTLDEEAEAKNY